ncbi:MAG: hypothetical protein HXX13_06640 [Bacteroidetes bacterium]|nr:hypothetical protein [Bacteroidota bacterium]
MKTFYKPKFLQHFLVVLILFFSGVFSGNYSAYADIYQPEGLNMPGVWNGWTNPPANNLALASYTQVTNGRVTKMLTGTPRWQTIFSVAASGGDLTGGTYQWLFTSGATSSPWGNKWGGVTNVTMNTLQNYNLGGANNGITISNGKWYTMNWQDNGYANTQAIYMETSAQPVNIQAVSVPVTATAGVPVTVTVTLSAAKCAEEIIYLRYTTNNWTSSSVLPVSMTGTTGTVIIPGQPDGTTVACYAFSSTLSSVTGNYDMVSIKINNNGGVNYSYPVGAPPISWANLDSPASATINPGQTVNVYSQVYIAGATGQSTAAPGVQAWIGYSLSNTNPNTWTDWVAASYVSASGVNDKYKATIGSSLAPGAYYYASRFKLGAGAYVYGGYNGGYWDGTTNISGVLTVSGAPPAVTTGSVSSVTSATASIGGTVVSDGGATVTSRGICWSTAPSPTILNSHTSDGTGIGSFSGSLTSLTPGTTYYAKAYATNSYGTSYGDEVTFTTLYTVTFYVDMSTFIGTFVPGVDLVYIAGGFPNALSWNVPGSNPDLSMTQVGSSLTYTVSISLPAGTYPFKHFHNAGWNGGEWTGGTDRSVVVSGNMVVNSSWGGDLEWVNLQWPLSGTILPSGDFNVSAQAFVSHGKTGIVGGDPSLQCWIGYSTSQSDPSTWTHWVPASYSSAFNNANDEFVANIGSGIAASGTYYYASRFKLGAGNYLYGGYNSGIWNGTTNISGTLNIVNSFTFTVTTGAVSSLSGTSVTVNGNVLADGGNAVTDRGICYGTSADPTLANSFVQSGAGLGEFTVNLTSLLPGTTYHARAYATNSTGTIYGSDIQFTTYYHVTFNIDMSTCSSFVEGVDSVYIAGGFPSAFWHEPGTNQNLKFSAGPIHSLTLDLPAGTYEFKHFLNATWAGGEWIAGGNRSVIVSGNDTYNNTWGGSINWANLQYPGTGSMNIGDSYDVYAQAYIPNGITAAVGGTFGLHAWIGYSTNPTDPSTWTNWIPADFSSQSSDNDEFKANLGIVLTTPGTYYYASRFRFGNGSYVYGGYYGGYWDGTNNISGVLTVLPPATKTCYLKIFIEELYDGVSGTMKQAMDVGPLPKFGTGIADQVTIELHNASTPYATAYTFSNVDLLTDGSVSISTIPGNISGSYYIVVKHRNSIETWSNSAIAFDLPGAVSFDFTTDAAKAYMSNLKSVGTAWVIYGGDATADGVVDGSDMANVDNASTALLQGYLTEDVNGDGIVDGTDMAMVDNNSTSVVQVQRPSAK